MDSQMHAIDYFATTLPARPRCANDPTTDNRIRARARAIAYRLIEPNTSGSLRWLTFDVDRPGAALDWEDCRVPAPTIVCQNPANGHAHLLYALRAPVARSNAARLKPLHFAEMIEHSLRTALRADTGYAGALVKNPLHDHWRVSAWADAYELDELADNLTLVPRRLRPANDDTAGLGRNCETFERLRKYAYRAVRDYWGPQRADTLDRFAAELEYVAGEMQADYITPLPPGEIRAIARSVARWVWRNFDPTTFRRIQAARGRKKGASRKAELLPRAIALAAEGRSRREIAADIGVPVMTVSDWLRGLRT